MSKTNLTSQWSCCVSGWKANWAGEGTPAINSNCQFSTSRFPWQIKPHARHETRCPVELALRVRQGLMCISGPSRSAISPLFVRDSSDLWSSPSSVLSARKHTNGQVLTQSLCLSTHILIPAAKQRLFLLKNRLLSTLSYSLPFLTWKSIIDTVKTFLGNTTYRCFCKFLDSVSGCKMCRRLGHNVRLTCNTCRLRVQSSLARCSHKHQQSIVVTLFIIWIVPGQASPTVASTVSRWCGRCHWWWWWWLGQAEGSAWWRHEVRAWRESSRVRQQTTADNRCVAWSRTSSGTRMHVLHIIPTTFFRGHVTYCSASSLPPPPQALLLYSMLLAIHPTFGPRLAVQFSHRLEHLLLHHLSSSTCCLTQGCYLRYFLATPERSHLPYHATSY